MFAMKVTTITPVYNNGKYLEACIDSLLANHRDGLDIEHIFVNDGSSDDSLRLLKRYERAGIKIVHKEMNEGIAAAYRDAMKIAEGDILVFLDADDIAHPDRVRLVAESFEHNERIGIVYHAFEFMDENGESLNLFSRLPSYVNGKDLFFQLFKRNFFTGSALAVRNFAWLKSDLDIICCDYYFCMQIAERGYEFRYIDRPLIRYRVHKNNTSSRSERMFDSFRQVQSRYPVSYLMDRWTGEGYSRGDILSTLGVMEYYYMKNAEAARRYFLEARALGTRDIHTYFYLGCLYYSDRQYDEALEQFQTVCRMAPDCFQAVHNIGIIHAVAYRDMEKAGELLARAREIQPFYMLVEHQLNLILGGELESLKIIPVLTDEDNIIMTYCKLQAARS